MLNEIPESCENDIRWYNVKQETENLVAGGWEGWVGGGDWGSFNLKIKIC